MPKYRQLHVKILDSFDFNELPDDFTMLFFVLLLVVVDGEGRGIDNPAWIRSKMFPLRPDVDLQQIEGAMAALDKRNMIVRYEVDGRKYFYIPTFKEHQKGWEKEARSTLPAPQEQQNKSPITPDPLQSNFGVTPDLLHVNADADSIQMQEQCSGETPANDFQKMQSLIERLTGYPIPPTGESVKAINEFIKIGAIEDDIRDAIDFLSRNGKLARGPSSLIGSVKTAIAKRTQKQNGKPIIKPFVPEEHASEVYGGS